ncbi:type II toxin-antitoxin system RelE/ParE family toxin [Sorangium sp. So ce131]|uniref:type II toxin-antitoxin system RelE/ParE family toxin n=1 Tax=Sorangium sp. So ce131 TaxID=3133282 RepID=UPI003F5ED8C9
MSRLRVAEEADTQIRQIDAWWRTNRPEAPDLFSFELAEALESLIDSPTLGTLYTERRGVTIRRLILHRSRYHIYFSYHADADVVDVRAVWHASRGSGPKLA